MESDSHPPNSDQPLNASTDEELRDWLFVAAQKGGHFVSSLADAGLCADFENYAILRPLLLQMKAKYPYAKGSLHV
jgi:hypothetical protein